MSPGARTSSMMDEPNEEWRAVTEREGGRGWRMEEDAGRWVGMDMGLADFGERMAERGRGEGREGAGDEEGRGTAMAAGEFVEARRTGSFMKRLLKMRESLWGDVVGLCGMGREMRGAEYCNMGSRGRGRRRDQTRPAVSLSGPMFEQRCAEKEKKENRKEKKKREQNRKMGQRCRRERHTGAHTATTTYHMLHFLFRTRPYRAHMASIQTWTHSRQREATTQLYPNCTSMTPRPNPTSKAPYPTPSHNFLHPPRLHTR